MALTNYTTLKASIESWSHRNDVANFIDDFIDIAESEMWKTLRIRDMEFRATASATTKYLALPDNFMEMRKFKLTSGGNDYDIQYRVPEALGNSLSNGIPRYFTITSQIEFDRVPDTTYTVEMQYLASLTPLSVSNLTNAVITKYPAIYLYGGLCALYEWARNLERATYYRELFNREIQSANAKDLDGRYGAAPVMNYENPLP